MHWRCASCRSFEETLHCDRCVSMVCADRDDLQSRIDRAVDDLDYLIGVHDDSIPGPVLKNLRMIRAALLGTEGE